MSDRLVPQDDRSVDWLVALIIGGAVVVLAAVIAGLTAALAGWMVPITVIGLSIIVIGVFGYLFFAGRATVRIDWKTPVAVLAAGGVIVAFTVLGVRFAAEHLLTDRDPGVYVVTARWLASHGTLLVEGAIGAFANLPGIDGVSQGHYGGRADGLVYAQFQHGLAVAMAIGRWVGGDWLMLKSVALLSGGALATFYAFARIVLRPWWATAATAGVAINLVFVHFGRDAYSESLFMIFLFSGLWLLDRALRSGRWTASLLAGLMLGGTALVRIDAWLALSGIVAFLFVDVWTAGDRWQERVRRVVLPIAAGILITGGLGIIDLLVASPEYLSDLMPNVYRAAAIMSLVVGLGLLVSVALRPWKREGDQKAGRWRERVGTGAALFIVAGAAFLFFVRPLLFVERSDAMVDVIEYYQRLQGLTLDGTRRYWEMSMNWLGWYLGIGGLAIGVGGWAWATREGFAGRMKRALPFVFAFSIVTVAFLWRPANTPDHLWMMRRFLTFTIPGFVLFAFVLVQHLIPTLKERWTPTASISVTTVMTAIVLVPPAIFTAPLIDSTTQVGMYGVTEEVCATLGDDAAVLVVSKRLRSVYEPALRAFCEIPVSGAAERPSLELVGDASANWDQQGRRLFVASLPSDACDVTPVFETFIWYPEPERTLTRRPSAEVSTRFGIALYRFSDFEEHDPAAWDECIDAER
jgi:4-amino-4-deoxy-L-arabinose transferase-like glycosyltransferase